MLRESAQTGAGISLFLLISLIPRVAPAGEPPVCFPERTVMWAAHLQDEEGNDFGIIRAGHTVRVLETGVGKDGKLSKVELDKPARFAAFVESRKLLAFTAKEIDVEPGFSSVVNGLPVWIDGKGTQNASITPADPHEGHKPEWTVGAACGDLRGDPPGEVFRDQCHGGHVQRSTVWIRDERVFWETDVELFGPGGNRLVRLPSKEWAYMIADGKERVEVAYWDHESNIVYRGLAPRKGLQNVAKGVVFGTDHLCCEGLLSPKIAPFSVQADRRASRQFVGFSLAKTVGKARLRARQNAQNVAVFTAGHEIKAAPDENGFNAITWPGRDETPDEPDTIILYGFVESKNVEFAVPQLRNAR